jgi:putative ATP-grasp target RiPP
MNERIDDLAGLELAQEDLALVLGGMRPNTDKSSKVCDVGGGCWPDTDF